MAKRRRQKKKSVLRSILRMFLRMLLLLAILSGIGYALVRGEVVCYLPVPVMNQNPEYPTGCESVSLHMLLRYYGVEISTEKIVDKLPKGSVPYEVDGVTLGGNPEREFVGNPRDSSSFGVYQIPVRDVAESIKTGANQKSGASLEFVYEILKSGNPVLAWYTTEPGIGIEYKYSWIDEQTGETIHWPSHEHAVVITGFAPGYIFYNNPNTGERCIVTEETFRRAFNEMGGRIVWYEDGFSFASYIKSQFESV